MYLLNSTTLLHWSMPSQHRPLSSTIDHSSPSASWTRRLATIPGVGEKAATALVAAVGDASQFRDGREMAAWLGLVPRQHTTGGRPKLLGISKRGDRYLGTLLVHGARSALQRTAGREDRRSRWAEGVKRRGGGGAGEQERAHGVGRAAARTGVRRRAPGRDGRGGRRREGSVRREPERGAGNAMGAAASSRCAALPLRLGPSGDPAVPMAKRVATTGSALPAIAGPARHGER